MKQILVTGSDGQLGSAIRLVSANFAHLQFCFTDQSDLDICNVDALKQFLNENRFDYILNCAAYTAVDRAETDRERCYQVNTLAVENMAKCASEHGIRVIHVSTDYVYSGLNCKPYHEEEQPSPLSVYGQTKCDGERALLKYAPESVILRTSWLYSEFGANFVKTMIRLGAERTSLGVVYDQIGTPTYAVDLAEVMLQIVSAEQFIHGIYNYSNEGVCSWYDFALKIHKMAAIKNCMVHPIETSDFPTPAMRPSYSVMNKRKIRDTYGIAISHWENSLQQCIDKLLLNS